MIVEVTPRWRAMMENRGVDWSTDTLQRTILNHRVRVTGWLLFDSEHASKSANTATHPDTWRATAWEIHPITALEVVDAPSQ